MHVSSFSLSTLQSSQFCACFLAGQIAQAAITLAITINILWDFNFGSELQSEREAENEERLFKASATWDSDVQGEQNTLEEDYGGLFEQDIKRPSVC